MAGKGGKSPAASVMPEMQKRKALSKEQAKIRVLLIYKMLECGDKISVPEIIDRLNHRGINVNRRTVYSDIQAIDRIVPIQIIGSARYTKYMIMEQNWG